MEAKAIKRAIKQVLETNPFWLNHITDEVTLKLINTYKGISNNAFASLSLKY